MEAAWADLCRSRSLPVAVAVGREERGRKERGGGQVRIRTKEGKRRRKEEAEDFR